MSWDTTLRPAAKKVYLNRTIDIRLLQVMLTSPPEFFQTLPKIAELLGLGFGDSIARLATARNAQRPDTLNESPAFVGTMTTCAVRHLRRINSNWLSEGIDVRDGLTRARNCFRLILIQLVVERLEGDPQLGGGLRFVASVSLQSGQNQLFFHRLDRGGFHRDDR